MISSFSFVSPATVIENTRCKIPKNNRIKAETDEKRSLCNELHNFFSNAAINDRIAVYRIIYDDISNAKMYARKSSAQYFVHMLAKTFSVTPDVWRKRLSLEKSGN